MDDVKQHSASGASGTSGSCGSSQVASSVGSWLSWSRISECLRNTLPWSFRLRLAGVRGGMNEVAYDELERENLWTEYEVPMHFITLEFEDVEMERGFQVDMARRRLGTYGGDSNEKSMSLTLSHLSLLAFCALLAWIKYTLWHPSETCATRLGARDISFMQALQSEPLVALMSSSFIVWTISVFLVYFNYKFYVNNFYLVQSLCSIHSLALYLLYEYLSIRFIPDTDVSVTMEEGISFTIVISLIAVFYSLRFIHVIYLMGIGAVVTSLLRPLAYSTRVFRRLGFLANEWNEGVFVVAALCILLVVIYCYERLLRKDFIMSLSLAAESESSDKILKSVLPDHVVGKLLGEGCLLAAGAEATTVPSAPGVGPVRRGSAASVSARLSPPGTPGPGGQGALPGAPSILDSSALLGGITFSESYESVTTLFIEICGLSTAIAQTESKEKAVEALKLLARMFGVFDEIADFHGLEKIKSIGDVYMAVGGLRGGKEDVGNAEVRKSAEKTVVAGKEMMKVAKTMVAHSEAVAECNLQVKCGIHTGPVVAGIIGRKRFAYDVWGDAVVIASRMQTTAEFNESVHISEATADLVKGCAGLEIACRGPQLVKGKGQMVTYRVALE